MLTQFYPPEMGAPQVRLAELAALLAARGWRIDVLTALPNYPSGRVFPGYPRWRSRRETVDGVEVLRVPLLASKVGMLRRVVTYLSFVVSAVVHGWRQPPADVVLVESPPLFIGLAARALARRWRTPYVLNVSDLWPDSAVDMGILRDGVLVRSLRVLERWTYGGAAALTAQSDEIAAALRSRTPGRRVVVVTNGVDPDRFPDARSSPGTDTTITCIYAGLFGYAQGLETLLDAAALLRTRHDIRFVLVGDGPVRADLEARIDREGLANVEIRPQVAPAAVPALLTSADVAVVTLGHEIRGAVPSKIYEAMAARLPIVLVAAGEAARRVRDASCGVVVAPGDAAGLARAMEALADDPEERRRLSAAGRMAAETTYRRSAIVERLDELLRDVVRGAE